MRFVFSKSVLVLVLITFGGCGTDNVRYQNFSRSASWRGTYVTAPEEFKKIGGKGYARLEFLIDGTLQISVHDESYPKLVWKVIAQTERLPNDRASLLVSCQKSEVLGEGPVLEYLEKSEILHSQIPEKIKNCSGENVLLRRQTLYPGEVKINWTTPEGSKTLFGRLLHVVRVPC